MSELTQAPGLMDLLSASYGGDHWLVLEQRRDTLKRLYTLQPAPELAWLFHNTPYAAMVDHSPLVVRVSHGSALLKAFAAGQGSAPLEGILVSSTATSARVLAQLRKCLDIRFYTKRQALLRYYDPWVAAAFFSAKEPLDHWLGPLHRVIWFGGTFAQRAQRGPSWYAFSATTKPTATVDADELPALSHHQERALENLLADYPLWRHLIEHAALDETNAEHAKRFLSALSEAEHLSLPQQDVPEFLALRFAHFQAALPEAWEAQPADKRLAMLRQYVDTREKQTPTERDGA